MADDDDLFDDVDPDPVFVSAPSCVAPQVDNQANGEAPVMYDETRQRSVSHSNKVPLSPGLSDPPLAPGTWSSGASGSAPPGVAPNPNLWNGAVGQPGVAPNPNLWNGAVGQPGVAPNPNLWNGAVGQAEVAPNPNLWNGAVGPPGVAPNPNLWNGAVGTSGPAVPTTVPTVPADINPWSGYSLARQDHMDVASPYMPRRSYPADPHLRLRRAVCHNDRATVLEALRCGGGLGRDKSGKTAMHYAANRGNYELLYILMDHGLDPNVACYNGYTVVDEAEYWAMNGSEPARHMRRRCRDLLAAYGGRRSYNSETVMNDRLRLENKNFGIQPPWRDDLEKVGRESQWMKQEPKIDGWTPPIADVSDLPDPEAEISDEGRPGPTPWDPAPAVPIPAPARPIPAPAARAVPTVPAEPAPAAPATADSTWGDSEAPLKPLREILLGRSYATREEFTDCTNEVRDLILDLQKHPRNLYIKMRPVPPFDPNGRSYEV